VEPFGASLKKERERRKITLEEISASTKISSRMLTALEEEQFDRLPGGVFNRGFVRSYARALGMDEKKTVSSYMAAAGEQAEEKPLDLTELANAKQKQAKRRSTKATFRGRTDISWSTVGAAAFLILVAVLAVWGLRSGELANLKRYLSKSATTFQLRKSSVASAATVSPDRQPADGVAGPAKADSEPDSPEDSNLASGADDAKPTLVSAPAGALPIASSATPAPILLRIKANSDCWLTITADDKPLMEGQLAAGEHKTFHATTQITVKAGSIGGLNLSFNGHPLPSQGEIGEVKVLEFDPNGLIASAH
jgi:cytoskeleton protein RodZ